MLNNGITSLTCIHREAGIKPSIEAKKQQKKNEKKEEGKEEKKDSDESEVIKN